MVSCPLPKSIWPILIRDQIMVATHTSHLAWDDHSQPGFVESRLPQPLSMWTLFAPSAPVPSSLAPVQTCTAGKATDDEVHCSWTLPGAGRPRSLLRWDGWRLLCQGRTQGLLRYRVGSLCCWRGWGLLDCRAQRPFDQGTRPRGPAEAQQLQEPVQLLLHGDPELPTWLVFPLVGSKGGRIVCSLREREANTLMGSASFQLILNPILGSFDFQLIFKSLLFFTLLGTPNRLLGSFLVQLSSFPGSLYLQWSPKQFF